MGLAKVRSGGGGVSGGVGMMMARDEKVGEGGE